MSIQVTIDAFGASVIAVVVTSFVSWLIRAGARRDQDHPGMLEIGDATLWLDWLTTALVAFAVFALKTASDGRLPALTWQQSLSLLLVGLLTIGVIPTYVRFFGYDAAGRLHVWRGIMAPNVLAIAVLVTTLKAGVYLV